MGIGTGVSVKVGQPVAATYSPWVAQAQNLATNPSFETASGSTIQVYRNEFPNPGTIGSLRMSLFAGATNTASASNPASTSSISGTTRRVTWSAVGSPNVGDCGIIVGRQSGVDIITAGTDYTIEYDLEVSTTNSVTAPTLLSPSGTFNTVARNPGRTTVVTAGTIDHRWLTFNADATAVADALKIVQTLQGKVDGDWMQISNIVMYPGPKANFPTFSGFYSPDVDLTPAWVGVANQSASQLRGTLLAGVATANPERAFRIQSTAWKRSGNASVRVIPLQASSYAEVSATPTWVIGETYTVLSYIYIPVALTGALMARALEFWVIGGADPPVTYTSRATNAPGVYEVRGTFVAQTTTHNIRLMNGANLGNGEVFWDDVFIYRGVYTGPYFSGDTPNTNLAQFAWDGTANASPSTYSTRTILDAGYSGIIENITDYSVTEDSTPLDPSDMTGGFGQVVVGTRSFPSFKRLMNEQLNLKDGSLGEIVGTVRGLSGDDIGGTITANSRIGLLAVERTIQPFVGTLGAALVYHLGLVGITTNYVIDSSLNAINVRLPGGRENVYDRIKHLAASHGFELSLVSGNIVFRLPRQRVSVNYRDATIDWDYDQSNLARSVQGYAYNTTSGTACAYPLHGDTQDMDIWQVNAGETRTWTIQLDASLSSVIQPTPALFVAENDVSASTYVVAAADQTVVQPAEWTRAGGSVSVVIGEDTRAVTVTVTGMLDERLSPYRIAVPLGNNEYYSSLRILGTGVFWNKTLQTIYLGGNQDLAPDEVGALVDVPFMETPDQLYHRLLFTAARYSTDTQQIRVSARGINRLGDSGSAKYPTIGDVQALYPGATIGSIYPLLGPTIADWNAKLFAAVSSDFANQAFGNVNGARVRYDNSWYRIRTSTLRPNSVEYAAERDNVIGDVYRTGETIGQWNARWANRVIRDVNIAPLIP